MPILPLKSAFQVTSYEALSSMVESGLGIGLMPIDIAPRTYIKSRSNRSLAIY